MTLSVSDMFTFNNQSFDAVAGDIFIRFHLKIRLAREKDCSIQTVCVGMDLNDIASIFT